MVHVKILYVYLFYWKGTRPCLRSDLKLSPNTLSKSLNRNRDIPKKRGEKTLKEVVWGEMFPLRSLARKQHMFLSILTLHTYHYSMPGTVLGTGSFQHTRPNHESTLHARHRASDTPHDDPASSGLSQDEDTESQWGQVPHKLTKATWGRTESKWVLNQSTLSPLWFLKKKLISQGKMSHIIFQAPKYRFPVLSLPTFQRCAVNLTSSP